MSDTPIHVIKLGGSLLDLPDLGQRWNRFCDKRVTGRPLLVVGGGDAADTVRNFDQRFKLDETEGHWLAVHAMQFNARLVEAVVPNIRLAADMESAQKAWNNGHVPAIDPVAWLRAIEQTGITVPHKWIFTSDSIAALLATQIGAGRLTLLKSTLPTGECDVSDASRLGIVDEAFPTASQSVASVELVNLRHDAIESPQACYVLR